MSHKYMNEFMHHSEYTHRSDYGTKIKEDYPKCYTDPRMSRLGSTTDQLERSNTKDKIFIELLLELGCVTFSVQRHLQAGFGSICESRGLSNLTPLRSRLFKLMGKVKVWGGAAAVTKQVWWLTYANKSEKRNNRMVVKLVMIKKWS